MLSVFSCTMSVFSRLSARTKAPCSTVSSSMVAALSCSLVLSSLHAAWAFGCSKLLTVSTMAWGSPNDWFSEGGNEGKLKRLGTAAVWGGDMVNGRSQGRSKRVQHWNNKSHNPVGQCRENGRLFRFSLNLIWKLDFNQFTEQFSDYSQLIQVMFLITDGELAAVELVILLLWSFPFV